MAEHDKTFKRTIANKQSRAEVCLSRVIFCVICLHCWHRKQINHKLSAGKLSPLCATQIGCEMSLSRLPFVFRVCILFSLMNFHKWHVVVGGPWLWVQLERNLRSMALSLCHLSVQNQDSDERVRAAITSTVAIAHKPPAKRKTLLLFCACDRRQQ